MHYDEYVHKRCYKFTLCDADIERPEKNIQQQQQPRESILIIISVLLLCVYSNISFPPKKSKKCGADMWPISIYSTGISSLFFLFDRSGCYSFFSFSLLLFYELDLAFAYKMEAKSSFNFGFFSAFCCDALIYIHSEIVIGFRAVLLLFLLVLLVLCFCDKRDRLRITPGYVRYYALCVV